ncbi:DUF4132 domain-containing protein, partial [Mycobacteroides abscessus]|uniref:DUF4132 domain-containing protein n=1 Tax=Mycobacteroides abscessus TaxID=36809 RepID=UPI003CECC84E
MADAEDNPFELDENAVVGAVHPAQLSAELLAAWSELFADYELLQPFPQLSRPVYRLTDSENWRTAPAEHTASAPVQLRFSTAPM